MSGQKTQTPYSRSVYGPTIARSFPCNPLCYSSYSPRRPLAPERKRTVTWWEFIRIHMDVCGYRVLPR